MRPTTTAKSRLTRTGLGLTLLVCLVAPGFVAADDPPPVKLIYHNKRSLRIPFNIVPSERPRIKEILLVVSSDQGLTWKPIGRSRPDAQVLEYRTPQDGEYWFAVQTLDNEGRLFPPKTAVMEPGIKVIVDTVPPTLSLDSNGRRGSLASVRWEIRDERLDRGSFTLEYQAQGARDWRQVPVRKPTPLIGEVTFDAGTAEPIQVRAQVSDRAKNTTDAALLLRDGTPENPALSRNAAAEPPEPPPLGSFTSGEVNSLPQFPSQPTPAPAPPAMPPPASGGMTSASPYNPFDSPPRAAESNGTPGSSSDGGMKPQLIRSPKFNLQYEVEDAGPNGPASVELYVTQDGGRTWSRREDDPDRKSPYPVDLGGEGIFGLTLVAKSASNLGDPAPAPGDRPQYLVEVDSTPPTVKLDPIKVGTGPDAGKIVIIWHASDLHLGPKPVVISVHGEGPNTVWQPIGPPIENTGQFIWTVPANTPQRFFVRVDVVDTLGNRNADETPETNPVLMDRTKPKSRIIGLDPSARNAAGPSIMPLR